MKLPAWFVTLVLPTLAAAFLAVGCTHAPSTHARTMPDRPAAPVQLSVAPAAPADSPTVVAVR